MPKGPPRIDAGFFLFVRPGLFCGGGLILRAFRQPASKAGAVGRAVYFGTVL